MSTPYQQKLRDPRWQRKRLEIMERDGFSCQNCGDEKAPLHVHHKYYTRGSSPWEYDNSALVTLCEPCHTRAEALTNRLNVVLAKMDSSGLEAIVGYCLAKLLVRESYGGDEFRPTKVKIGSWEEAGGFGLASITPRTTDGMFAIDEYLILHRDGVASSSDPNLEPVLSESR